MKYLKILFITLCCFLTFSTGAKAEFFSDIILAGTQGVWVDARSYSSLSAAVTAIGANDRELVIVSPQVVTSLTIPSNVRLKFIRDGSITHSGQLTINTKNIEAEDRQIFTGVGNVDFAPGTVLRSAWFSNIETAFAWTSNDTVTLIVSKPQTITASYSPGNSVTLRWEAPGNILTVNVGVTVSNIGQVEAGLYQLFAGAGHFHFRDGPTLNLEWFPSSATNPRLRSAVTWIDTAKVTLVSNEASTVDWSVVVPTNVSLQVKQGGILTISPTKTLTINGDFSAGSYRTFIATGTVTGLTKANVLWFGADPTNTSATATATTTAIQAAINSAITVYFPSGNYKINSSLNCTFRGNGGNPVIYLEGDYGYGASVIWWEGNATSVIVDFTRSRFGRIKNLSIKNTVGYPTQVGILCARGTAGGDNSDDFYLEDVHVWGYFTKAAVYTVTSEGTIYLNCTFANYHNSGYTLARAKTNVLSVTSAYQTITAFNGNTIGWLYGCHIYHYGTGTPILLDGTEGFGMRGGFIYSFGGVSGIELTGNTNNLDIQNVNYESGGTHFLYFSGAASVNQNIKLSNIISISESTSYANAAIYAVDGSIILGLTVDKVLGYRSGGGAWYLMSVNSLYGATIDDPGDSVLIRGANSGVLLSNRPQAFPRLLFSGDIEATGDLRSRRYYWADDFDDEVATVQLESSLNADFWVTAGTLYAAANVTYLGQLGGTLKVMCANADNDSVTILGIGNIRSDLNPILEARVKIDTKETAAFYVGFASGAFADVNGAFANDAFLVGINSDNGHGFGATRIVAASVNNGAAVVYDDMGVSIASNTYVKIKIDLNDLNQPRVWIDDVEVAAASIIGTVATQKVLPPYIMVQNLAGGAIQRFVTVDYLKIWMDRL